MAGEKTEQVELLNAVENLINSTEAHDKAWAGFLEIPMEDRDGAARTTFAAASTETTKTYNEMNTKWNEYEKNKLRDPEEKAIIQAAVAEAKKVFSQEPGERETERNLAKGKLNNAQAFVNPPVNAPSENKENSALNAAQEAIENLNAARENLVKLDLKKAAEPFAFLTLEQAKQDYKDACVALVNMKEMLSDPEVNQPEAIEAAGLVNDALEKNSAVIKELADVSVVNLQKAREDFRIAKEGINPFALSLEEAKQNHENARKAVGDMGQKYADIEELKNVHQSLQAEMTKDTAEMEKYNKPTPPAKSSANVSGAGSTEKTADLEANVKKVFGENASKYEIKGDQNSVLVTSKEGKPVLNISSESIKPLVSLLDNEELTKNTINTAKELYGEPLVAFSADPKEKAYIEKVAKKMNVEIKVAVTSEEYKQLQTKTPEPKPGTSITSKTDMEKFSDPYKSSKIPESLTSTTPGSKLPTKTETETPKPKIVKKEDTPESSYTMKNK